MDYSSINRPEERLKRLIYKSIYIAVFVFFGFKIYQFNHFNYGYTLLPRFNHDFQERSLEVLKNTPHYTLQDGYDGQFYAQLALSPTAQGPEIEKALDNYTYRARRILFSWTAWALGMGDPYWVLQAYSLQNALFWFLTAIILIHWLPPNNWQNTIRFIACFFTAGFIQSFSRALLDGPSLCLIAFGALLIETNRSWLGSAILGLAGLGKETNLLSVFALLGPGKLRSNLNLRFFLQASIAILPFVLWFLYILSSRQMGNSENIGSRNFDLPLVAFFSTFLNILKKGGETGFPARMFVEFAILGSLLIQALYLLCRPKWDKVWSRIGIAYAVLMLVMGPAVWEGLHAAPRVLLPMTIAFNLLFPRKLILLPILIAANTLTFVGLSSFNPLPVAEHFEMADKSNFAYDTETHQYFNLEFTKDWSVIEGKQNRYWRWSEGDSEAEFFLPGKRRINAEFQFTPKTISPREIFIEINGKLLKQVKNESLYGDSHTIPIILQPGKNTLRFYSPTPAERIGDDPRDLSFALVDYKILLISPVAENE